MHTAVCSAPAILRSGHRRARRQGTERKGHPGPGRYPAAVEYPGREYGRRRRPDRGQSWVKIFTSAGNFDRLVLDVRERTPVALVKQSGDFYLMDAEGFVQEAVACR